MKNKNILSVIGATILASLCCVTPVLAVLAGSSSLASSFSFLAPYHNYLVVITLAVLAWAWYDKLKKDVNCACDDEKFYSGKPFLALVTIFSLVMLSFPLWGSTVFASAPTAESCATGTCESNITQDVVAKLSVKKETHVNKDTQSLPVLQYMHEEKLKPTECGQVACSGTGYKSLDDLMSKVRKTVPEMSPLVLKKMIDNEDDFILIDVREASQRAEGEIYADESYAIPRTNLEFEILNIVKDKDAVVVLYTRQGARSLFAAESIKRLGYTHVYSLSAGLKGWVRAGFAYDNGLGTVLKVVDAQ